MKKHFLFVAALAATMMAQATVVVDETFTDFPGTAWTASGSVTTGPGRSQVAALTYSDATGAFVLSGQGNAVKTELDASDKYQHTKTLPNPVTTDCYVSFLLRADGQQKQSQTQVFGLGSPSLAPRVWLGKGVNDATKCRLGVTRSSGTGADVQWGATELATDETMLVVLKYTMTATDTVASIYVNPTIGGAEPSSPFASDNTKGINKCKKSLTNMTFYTTGSTKSYFTVSGARVCTTWAEAVAQGSAAPQENPTYADHLFVNFSDSVYFTNTVETAPASGSFRTDTVGDYIFTAAAVVKSGKTMYFDTDSVDYVKFYARAHIDKNTYKGSVEMPWVSHIDTLYLYGHSGSDSKELKIEYRIADGNWTALTTITMMKSDDLYAVPVKKDNIKIRVANNTTSAQYLFYVGDVHPRTFAEHKQTTGIESVQSAEKAVKMIENGQIVILKNGRKYNALGAEIK